MKNKIIESKSLLSTLQKAKRNGEKMFAILLDPDKISLEKMAEKKAQILSEKANILLVGGSLVQQPKIDAFIEKAQEIFDLPICLFPGSPVQFSDRADALLFLSLISGRNADYLIGRHIEIAPLLKRLPIEVIATGYMLVNHGEMTSVGYISDTRAIPAHKPDIAVATAQAGELLGLSCIYMEAGSGADIPIPVATINKVSKGIDIPLIVGGGIKTMTQREEAWQAGADLVVVGTALE